MAIMDFKLLPKRERFEGHYHAFEFDFSLIKDILISSNMYGNRSPILHTYVNEASYGAPFYSTAQYQEPIGFGYVWYGSRNVNPGWIVNGLISDRYSLASYIKDWSPEQLKHVCAGVTGLKIDGINGSNPPYLMVRYDVDLDKILSNLTVSSARIDGINALELSWFSVVQETFELEYTTNGTTKTITGTTAKKHIFPANTLAIGEYTWRVKTKTRDGWGSEWISGTPFTVYSDFAITTLEPNKIAQNKDKPIVAMWSTTDAQTQFELLYSGSVSGKITGTTARTHTFPAGMFGNGTVTLTLRVFNGYVWTEKVAEFMAYGAPPNPALTTLSSYNTAIPNITWTATEQVSYRVQILKNNIVVLDSSDVYSGNKNHRFTNVLENNTTYTARLRVRNQYEIESEWVSKTFTVAFTELQKPNFDMFANDSMGTVMFNIYNAMGQSNFKHCEILRREYGETIWNRIAINLPLTAAHTDYTCRSGILYEYKVRAIGTSGGYTDSETELKEISLRNTMISDTTDFNNYVVLIHNPTKTRGFAKETHAMKYSGLKSPSFEFGEVRYTNMNISFTVDEKTLDKLLDLYYSNNVLLFRDNRGKKIYGHISGEPSAVDAELMNYTVSFNFTETNYIEGVLV